MPTYSPSAPWAGPYPQDVTDEFGNAWIATGPNQLKKPGWEPPVFEAPEDCCHYILSSTANLVEGEPTAIVGAPAGPDKSDGDTATQKHPNGFSTWTCNQGNWVLDWVCIFPQAGTPTTKADIVAGFANAETAPENSLALFIGPDGQCYRAPIPPQADNTPPEVWIGDSEPEKTAEGGSYKVWFNCNDGCVYYCQEDGIWLAPKGCPLKLQLPAKTESGLFDLENDKLITEQSNPFMTYEHENGGLNLLRCDQSGVCITATLDRGESPAGTQVVDAAFGTGPLDGTNSCHEITTPKCGPHRVRLEYTIGYNLQAGSSTNAANFFNPQWSINGGATYANYTTSGVDAVVHTADTTVGQMGEKDFTDYVYPLLAGDTTYTLCSRTALVSNGILSGAITAFASTFRSTWAKLNCCDIAAPEG